jgi:hypothetical protein
MQTQIIIDFIGLFTFIAGLIIGLGAVTVIDIHGFIARRSLYWTRATISAHKVTKPMIWVGTFFGACWWYYFLSRQDVVFDQRHQYSSRGSLAVSFKRAVSIFLC